MPCFRPLKGYRSRVLTKNGKRGIVFNTGEGYADLAVEIACGQCRGCRLERSRQWAVRCVHEASLYERNCFITLTYDDQHVPVDHSLDKAAFQKFMKRLRFEYGEGIRYFHCGEYGEQLGRPHYHACIFNFDFPDRVFEFERNGIKIYTSKILSSLWPFGFSTVGDVTFESAAYVARYVMKKVTGDDARGVTSDGCPGHYTYIDEGTGEFFERLPEYVTMSRRPGIGARWFEKYATDVFPDDFVVIRGMKMKPPKFYDRRFFGDVHHIRSRFPNLFKLMDDSGRIALLDDRIASAFEHREDNTPERLRVRERVLDARLRFLKREVE